MSDRANTKSYWNKIWSNPKRRLDGFSMRDVVKVINEKNPKSILDLGCGRGKTLFMVKEGRDCFGIDISEVAINILNNLYGVPGKAMDVEDVEILGRKFDFIILNNTLEHVYKDEELLIKCKNVLNPSGTIYCSVPNGISSPEETEEHCQMYTMETLRSLMTKVFGNIEMRTLGHHLIGISTI